MHCIFPTLLIIGALATQIQGQAFVYLHQSVVIGNAELDPGACQTNCAGDAQAYQVANYRQGPNGQGNSPYADAVAAVSSAIGAIYSTPPFDLVRSSVTAFPAGAIQSRIPQTQWDLFTSFQDVVQSLQSRYDSTGALYNAASAAAHAKAATASSVGASGASTMATATSSASGTNGATPASGSAASAPSVTSMAAATAQTASSSAGAARATGLAMGAMLGAVAGVAWVL